MIIFSSGKTPQWQIFSLPVLSGKCEEKETMKYLAFAYLILYIILTGAGIRDDIRSSYSRWVIALDIASSLAAIAGIILWLFAYDIPWTGPFFAILIGTLTVAGIDVYDAWKTGQAEADQLPLLAVMAVGIEIPSYYINYLLAFKQP